MYTPNDLGIEIWNEIRELIPEEDREQIATIIVGLVDDFGGDLDWDGTSILEEDAGMEGDRIW